MKRAWMSFFLVLVLMISFTGCGSSGKTSAAADMAASEAVSVKYSMAQNKSAIPMGQRAAGNEVMTEEATMYNGAEVSQSDGSVVTTQNTGIKSNSLTNISQKIIFTGQVDLETLDFDKSRTELCDYMLSIGAYQQSSSINGGRIGYKGLKSAQYVFRVPKTKYDQSFIDLGKIATVVYEQSNGEDVTEQYFDTEARLKSLKIQQERLLELLKKAAKMEDILKIEKELQETNYEIENLTGTLRKWDSLVEYSTLTVNLNEVEQIKPVLPKENEGLWYRISSGFKNSVINLWDFVQDAIVALAEAIPVLLPLGVIGYLVYRFIRRKISKTKTVVKTKVNTETQTDTETENKN